MHYQSKSAVVTALTGPHTAIVHLDPSGRERCSGCAVASVCGVGTAADDFEVAVSAGVSVEPGDRVEIAAAASLTRRAVVVLLLLPLCVLVAAVAFAAALGASETVAVVVGMLALAAVFAVLYSLRRRLEAPGRWTIVRITGS